MFSIKKLQERNEDNAKKDEELRLKDLSALQSVACSIIKSSIAASGQVGAQG